MNFVQEWLLLLAAIVLTKGQWTLQHPAAQNYTKDILRLAKAAHIKAYLNEEKPPCDNFYKFACGNWARIHPAPYGGKSTYLDLLQGLYERKSSEMLSKAGKSDTVIDIKLKDFYESCLNTGKLEKVGLDTILRVVDFRGGWPDVLSEDWYEYEYDWLKVVATLRRKLGVDVLIGLNVVPDFEDKDMHRIMVGAPHFELTKDGYLAAENEELRQRYKDDIASKLRSYFPDQPPDWSTEVAQQVLDTEQSLANGLPHNSALTDRQTTRLRYIADLKAAYGNYVDLNRYFNLIFNQTIYVQVYETPEDYLANLVDVVKLTPKLTIANYTMWRVLSQVELNGDHRQTIENWCVHKVKEFFPLALESMFSRNYHSMQLTNDLQSVWADVKRTFREQLQTSPKLTWMVPETRQRAVHKLDAMEIEVSLPDITGFVDQIQTLKVRKDSYYQNLVNILEWRSAQNLSKLVERPVERPKEYKLPHYSLDRNKIMVPVTFLQARFFWDPSYPHALLYGTLGFLLAQQMLHGFDAQGRRYDSHGYQRGWWDTVSEYGFDNRAACFAKQYAKYEFPGWLNSGELNQTTTYVADNGALGVAYRAYRQWWTNVADTESAAQETLPPLLNYTQNQLFFIGFAQLWCADYHAALTDFVELPERWRVIGALANLNDFAREHKCDIGTKMNPEQKCALY